MLESRAIASPPLSCPPVNSPLPKMIAAPTTVSARPAQKTFPSFSFQIIKVKKATGPNAYTVAELYKLKGKLDKKNVVVSGKVVRVSAGIMGKNWVHIQDGSGDSKKGTHDLVVTSQTVPVIGEIVTVKGTLYKNKDFGGGYKYEVIMEKAEISIQ